MLILMVEILKRILYEDRSRRMQKDDALAMLIKKIKHSIFGSKSDLQYGK
jgi:hypothetical protein